MPENAGYTLLERLNNLLEDLGLMLSQNRSGGMPDQMQKPLGEPGSPKMGAWEWLENLLERLFSDLSNRLGGQPQATPIPVPGKPQPPQSPQQPTLAEKQKAGIPTPATATTMPADQQQASRQAKQYDGTLLGWLEQQRREAVKINKLPAAMFPSDEVIKMLDKEDQQKENTAWQREVFDIYRKETGKRHPEDPFIERAAKFEPALNQMMGASSNFGYSMANEKLGGAAAAAATGLQSLLSVMGPQGAAAAGIIELGKVSLTTVDAIREMTREVLNANFKFAEYSASMSRVQAEQEMRDISLSQRKGEARSESAEKLALAMSELNETMAPFENAAANWWNEVQAKLATMNNDSFKMWDKAFKEWGIDIKKALGVEDEDSKLPGVGFTDWVSDLGANYGRPPRFPPAG